jgi:hypothetical protein
MRLSLPDPEPSAGGATAQALTPLGVAGKTMIVGGSAAGVAAWAIQTYIRPHGAPVPDWIAAMIGVQIASAATFLWHIAGAALARWASKGLITQA